MAVNVNGGSLDFVAEIELAKFESQITQMQQRLKGFGDSAQREAGRFDDFFKKAATAAAGYLSINAASNFVQQMVRVRGEFQQLEVAYQTILKSKSAADQLMSETVKLAATTPFTLTEVAQSTKQLLAYGFGAKDVTDTLKTLGDIAAGVSAPIGDIAYLYGTLRTQGRAYTRDIMQFTSRGIPIIAELANQFGTTESEVQKLVEAGKVGFPQIEQAFKNLTGPTGIFFNLMEEQSKTLTGQLSNLQDAFDRMLNSLGKSNQGFFSGAIQGATALVDNYQDVLDIITVLIATYGAYRAAVLASAVALRIQQEAQLQVALSGRALTAAQATQAGAMAVLNQAGYRLVTMYRALATAQNASVAVLAGLGLAIYAVATAENAETKAAEALNKTKQTGAVAAETLKTKLADLTAVLKSQASTDEQRAAAMKQIQELTDGRLKQYSQEEIAAGKANTAIARYIDEAKRIAEAKVAFDEYNKSLEYMASLSVKGVDAVDRMQRLGRSLKNTFAPTSQGLSLDQWAKQLFDGKYADQLIVQQEQKAARAVADRMKKIQGGLDGKVAQIADTPKVKERTLATIDTEKQALEEQRKSVANRNEYAVITEKINALEKERAAITGEITKTEKKGNDERLNFLSKLSQLQKDNANERLLLSEQGIAQVKAEYASLRDEAKKAGLGNDKGVQSIINREENKALGDKNYAADTEKLKNQLDKQKAIYADYEQYKSIVGSAEADKRYAKDLGGFKSYLDYLQSEIAKVGSPQNALQEGRLKLLQEQANEEKKAQVSSFIELQKELQTFNQKRLALDAEYQAAKATLQKNGANNEIAELDRVFSERAKKIDQEEKAEIDSRAQAIPAYMALFKGIDQLSEKAARKVIGDAEDMLQKLISSGKISAEEAEKIRLKINETKSALRERSSQKLSGIASELRDIAGSLSLVDEGFAAMIGTLSNVVQGIVQISTNVDRFKEANKKNDLLGQASAGLGIAGAAIGVVSSIVGIFKASKESKIQAQKQLDEFNNAQYNAEFKVNQLYRERQREQAKLNATTLEGIRQATALYQKQASEASSAYDEVLKKLQGEQFVSGQKTEKYGGFLGIGRKTRTVDVLGSLAGADYDELERLFNTDRLTGNAKALFEQLRNIKEEIGNINETSSANDTLRLEIATGTTADDIAKGIIDGFDQGKSAIADFAGSFEDAMKKAALQSLASEGLKKQVDQFYKDFARDAESGGGLDKGEIDALRQTYNQIITDTKTRSDELSKVTGQNFGKAGDAANQQGLQGSIKQITEETAGVIAGNLGGLRITAVQHADTALKHLQVAIDNERNTRTIAENSAYLKAIHDKMSAGSSLDTQLRAAGGKI